MANTVGGGKFTYEVVENWGTLPTGWTFGPVSSVAVDGVSQASRLPANFTCRIACGSTAGAPSTYAIAKITVSSSSH
jgi:hypothetical protein